MCGLRFERKALTVLCCITAAPKIHSKSPSPKQCARCCQPLLCRGLTQHTQQQLVAAQRCILLSCSSTQPSHPWLLERAKACLLGTISPAIANGSVGRHFIETSAAGCAHTQPTAKHAISSLFIHFRSSVLPPLSQTSSLFNSICRAPLQETVCSSTYPTHHPQPLTIPPTPQSAHPAESPLPTLATYAWLDCPARAPGEQGGAPLPSAAGWG